MPNFEPHLIEQSRYDLNNTPHGYKGEVIAKWTKIFDCSRQQLYRRLDLGNKRKGESKIRGIKSIARIVYQIKKSPPEQYGEISTDQAIEIGIANNLIPANSRNMRTSIERYARKLRLNKKKRRVSRFQAEYPNQLHHVDASSSMCFYVDRRTDDGDYVFKLHAGVKGYKNKPVKIDRLRPWIYGAVDDYSGVYVGRYVVAHGESAVDNLDFMSWAWSKNDSKIFYGLPEKLKGDLGPMMRGKGAQDFFNRLGIVIDPSNPLNKESHGKIERPWRTVWQRFEKTFFVQTDWKSFEITLSEINRQFFIFQEECNNRPHRYQKDISRIDAWKQIINRGGAVAMPEKALSTVAKRIERNVGVDGCFTINNKLYEVKGLHDAKVYVYMGVFNDKIVVEDKTTGKKYEVEYFKPNPVGTYTAHKETPHQKAVKAAKDLSITNTLYSVPADQGKVAKFPVRTKETRKIDNPLDVDSYPSINAAMQDFISFSGVFPTGEDYEDIKKLFIKNSLNRCFVKEFAFKVQANENERRKING